MRFACLICGAFLTFFNSLIMKKFTVNRATDLKTFTDESYPQGSFAFAALLRSRDIKINGVRTAKNIKVSVGDEVVYYTTPAQEGKLSHNVIYSDENIIVCDKFSGVSTEGLLSELCASGEYYAVHRLDRNTEGLIIFARNRAAEKELLAAFKDRRIKKTYLALVKDGFRKDEDCLTAYLCKDEKTSLVKISDVPRTGYVRIITEYKVIERGEGLALVQIKLHTGRTHQIRAHMAHIGCPILGDEKYGDTAINAKYGARRQRLVAKYISFGLTGALSYLNDKVFESSFSPIR